MRQRRTRPVRAPRTAAALCATALCVQAFAQTPPDAGRLIQEQERSRLPQAARSVPLPTLQEPPRPALQAAPGLRVRVTAFRFSRNSAFTDVQLSPLLADLAGKELTLPELNAAADRITAHYRANGYFVACAYLPAQDINEGVVEITVLEGRLGKLTIDNRSLVADSALQFYFADLSEGSAIAGTSLERGLLLVNNLPGVDVQSTLRPGASVGATDLDIHIEGQQRLATVLSVDNYGNRFTGAWRLGGQFTVNSPLARGDALSLRAYRAGEGYRYGRLAYQLPVGGSGLQLGVATSTMRYRLGGDFADLGAHGSADIGSVYALYPLLRSRVTNVNIQLDYDHKSLDDLVDSSLLSARKSIDVAIVGLSGDHADELGGGGLNSWSLSYTGGQLHLDTENQALDAAGHRTAGHYDKLNLWASRLQRLPGDGWSLAVQVSGQLAGNNLDSSEKFALGGPKAVRAYPQGEAPVDDGWLASAELRYALAGAWQVSGFYDVGGGRTNHDPLAADLQNARTIAGAGLGVSYVQPGNLSVEATVAWRTRQAPTSDRDRTPRIWAGLTKSF